MVKTLLQQPRRLWSCSHLEELTKLPHATVFRTLQGLWEFGVLRSTRINKRDLVYEVVEESPLLQKVEEALDIDYRIAKAIALQLLDTLQKKEIFALLLYGSSLTGKMTPHSDIDVLVVLEKRHPSSEKHIFDSAAKLSIKINKTISVTILSKKEIDREREKAFLQSIKSCHEVLYGKISL
ncbi:MAG: nucleotidyltransferase domain-containing protein [Nanoarchaeota archaeon]|nr:nucleotidyltransferase domain-containing protein [Nanoarchaeota archaeon]